MVERGRAHEHARRPRCERSIDQLATAVATADLDRDADARDPFDEPEIRFARERTVEIDEMEPGRAFRSEALRGRHRVAAVDRDPLAPALLEADDATLQHVDRRIDGELLVLLLAC